MECISYKKGYKYQLVEDYVVEIPITPEQQLSSPSDFITLTPNGLLTIKKGYAWDGPSGPTIDTLNFMRGSLVHDALYQLIREEELDPVSKDPADRLLQKMCKEDGMSSIRAWVVYQAVKKFGKYAIRPEDRKPITKAPEACELNNSLIHR